MGPGWRTAPSAGSATVITEPSCTSCGWSSSSVPWRKISAHTSGSWSNTAIHSATVLAWTASRIMSNSARRFSSSSKSGTSFHSGSSNIQSSSTTRMNARNRRSRGLRELQPAPVLRQRDREAVEERIARRVGAGFDEPRRRERLRVLGDDVEDQRVPRIVTGVRLHHRRVHALPETARLALVQRGEDAVQRGLGRAPRSQRHRAVRGAFPLGDRSHQVVTAEQRHHQPVVAPHARVPTGATERGDRREHEAGIVGGEVVVAQSEPLDDAGAERLDHDVGPASPAAARRADRRRRGGRARCSACRAPRTGRRAGCGAGSRRAARHATTSAPKSARKPLMVALVNVFDRSTTRRPVSGPFTKTPVSLPADATPWARSRAGAHSANGVTLA